MKKSAGSVYILFLSLSVLFLFGCSEEHKQEPSVDTSAQEPLTEAVIEQPEETEPAVVQKTIVEQAGQTGQPEEPETTKSLEAPKETKEDHNQQAVSQENPDAQNKLIFAENNLKMAQKGILSYSQVVAICRGVIKDYPNTEYQRQAQDLLMQIPEDQHSRYKITDEELGL